MKDQLVELNSERQKAFYQKADAFIREPFRALFTVQSSGGIFGKQSSPRRTIFTTFQTTERTPNVKKPTCLSESRF